MTNNVRIVILGGGVAGLASAYYLSLMKGFDITVVEEKPVLGGKIHDTEISGTKVSLGGLLFMNWYKHTDALVKELNLSYSDSPLKSYKENAHLVDANGVGNLRISPVLLNIGYHILNSFICKPFSKTSLYHPDVSIVSDLREPIWPFKNIYVGEFKKYLDILLSSLGYPMLQNFPHDVLKQLTRYSLFGGTPFVRYLEGGPSILIHKLTKTLQERNVRMLCDTKALRIQLNQKRVITSKNNLAYDHLITTLPGSTHTALFSEYIPCIDYTQLYSVIVRTTSPLVIKTKDKSTSLSRVFFHCEDGKLGLVLLVALPELGNCYMAYLYNSHPHVKTSLSSSALLAKIKSTLHKALPEVPEIDLVEFINWKSMMPYHDSKKLAEIKSKNGLHNIHFAGDYMAFPCIETAIFNGKSAAERVISQSPAS